MNDFGLFGLRVVAGGYMVTHGLPKLRDADGEYAKSFESLGFHPGSTFVTQAGLVETLSGALIALGALGPVGPMMLLADMIVATVATTARAKHFDPSKHEVEALYAAIAVLLALSGPGKISLEGALDIRPFDAAWLRYLSVGAALAGAAFMLSQRTPSASEPQTSSRA